MNDIIYVSRDKEGPQLYSLWLFEPPHYREDDEMWSAGEKGYHFGTIHPHKWPFKYFTVAPGECVKCTLSVVSKVV
jgi:hypothetical protein